MKRLFSKIGYFFYNFWNYTILKKHKNFEKKLEDAIVDNDAHKAILILDIQKAVRKKTKRGTSDYIPLSRKSKAEIKKMVDVDFGIKMKEFNLRLTDNLKLV